MPEAQFAPLEEGLKQDQAKLRFELNVYMTAFLQPGVESKEPHWRGIFRSNMERLIEQSYADHWLVSFLLTPTARTVRIQWLMRSFLFFRCIASPLPSKRAHSRLLTVALGSVLTPVLVPFIFHREEHSAYGRHVDSYPGLNSFNQARDPWASDWRKIVVEHVNKPQISRTVRLLSPPFSSLLLILPRPLTIRLVHHLFLPLSSRTPRRSSRSPTLSFSPSRSVKTEIISVRSSPLLRHLVNLNSDWTVSFIPSYSKAAVEVLAFRAHVHSFLLVSILAGPDRTITRFLPLSPFSGRRSRSQEEDVNPSLARMTRCSCIRQIREGERRDDGGREGDGHEGRRAYSCDQHSALLVFSLLYTDCDVSSNSSQSCYDLSPHLVEFLFRVALDRPLFGISIEVGGFFFLQIHDYRLRKERHKHQPSIGSPPSATSRSGNQNASSRPPLASIALFGLNLTLRTGPS
jgi:hypothetical protein